MSTAEQTDPGHHATAYEVERQERDFHHLLNEASPAPPADSPATLSASDYCAGSGQRVDMIHGTRTAVCPDKACSRILNVRPGKDGKATLARHKPEVPATKAPARMPVEQALAEVLADEEAETVRAAHDRQARAESIAWSEWARRLVGTDAFVNTGWFGDTEVREDVLRERIASHVGALHVACVGWMRRTEIAERMAAAHLADTHAALARHDGYRTEVEQTVAELHAALDAAQARYLAAESALAAAEESRGLDPIVAPPEFRPAPIDEDVQRAEDAARAARRELAEAEAVITQCHGREWPADKADDIAAALDERRTAHRLAERRLRQAIERRERR